MAPLPSNYILLLLCSFFSNFPRSLSHKHDVLCIICFALLSLQGLRRPSGMGYLTLSACCRRSTIDRTMNVAPATTTKRTLLPLCCHPPCHGAMNAQHHLYTAVRLASLATTKLDDSMIRKHGVRVRLDAYPDSRRSDRQTRQDNKQKATKLWMCTAVVHAKLALFDGSSGSLRESQLLQ